MIIDTHCHYNLDPLFSEGGGWQDHWQNAQQHEVESAIVVGTDLITSQRAIDLAIHEKKFACAIGLHPHIVEDSHLTAAKIDELSEQLSQQLETALQTQKIVAIGETGLDFFRTPSSDPDYTGLVTLQEQLFINQISIADQWNLPLILHVRDTTEFAYKRTLELLHTYKTTQLPFVLHCVSGPLDYIKKALEMGGFIGVAGNLTYKNAHQIHEIVRFAPKDRLLLETDAPYLPPTPHRGEICQPWMIQLTAQALTEQFAVDLQQVTTNAWAVFPRLKKL